MYNAQRSFSSYRTYQPNRKSRILSLMQPNDLFYWEKRKQYSPGSDTT